MLLCKMKMSLLCGLMVFMWQMEPMLGARSGPFKSSFIRVSPCPSLTLPVDQEPSTFFSAELYNSTKDVNLMRGNITVIKDHRIKKMKAKGYVWENSKWKVNYLINNMGCNRIFFPVLCQATGLKYDSKTCTFHKGEYLFDNFNLNKIQHLWMSNQEYGKILWRIEVFSQIGSIFCYEYETLIEQIK